MTRTAPSAGFAPTHRPGAVVAIDVAELARRLGGRLSGPGAVVTGVQQDSRRVGAGDLFVALDGATVDGLGFVDAAVARGAAAVLTSRGRRPVRGDVAVIEVDGLRGAMARAAAWIHGSPTAKLRVVGITGTNGKTTSAFILQHSLLDAGLPTGVVGTLGYHFAGFAVPLAHTSPESDELQQLAAALVAAGGSHLVMEVSSIALDTQRVDEVAFDVGVFTNLTQDHLDHHGDMAAYAAAKDRLFFEHRPGAAVVNIDDPHGASLAERLRHEATDLWTVSAHDPAARVHAAEVSVANGIAMTVSVAGRAVSVASPLVGAHNVSNICGALGAAAALGVELDGASLGSFGGVPGRLERCDDPARDDLVAVVDYAHTPDALARVLEALRPASGALWCVFGCGGDRDPHKRGPMGQAVARGADVAIVTNDNPRREDPAAIAAAVTAGLSQAGARRVIVELDRRAAIDLAVSSAAPGDVVLVAGKGHEPYQIIGESVAPFDDRHELRRALAERRGG